MVAYWPPIGSVTASTYHSVLPKAMQLSQQMAHTALDWTVSSGHIGKQSKSLSSAHPVDYVDDFDHVDHVDGVDSVDRVDDVDHVDSVDHNDDVDSVDDVDVGVNRQFVFSNVTAQPCNDISHIFAKRNY